MEKTKDSQDACTKIRKVIDRFFEQSDLSSEKAHKLFQQFAAHAKAPKELETFKKSKKKAKKPAGGCQECLDYFEKIFSEKYSAERVQNDKDFVEKCKKDGISGDMFDRYNTALIRYERHFYNQHSN